MMIILKFWREILILILCVVIGWLMFSKQEIKHELANVINTHKMLVKEAELKNTRLIAEHNEQRRNQLEDFTNEVLKINNRYDVALANSNRVQQEVTTYNNRLHTVTREAVENYAKVGTTLYNECRKEYLSMGQYIAKVDAELDSITKRPD